MTQKEFLKTFLEALGLMDNHLKLHANEDIDKFLEYHHKDYFEVEHIRKEEDTDLIIYRTTEGKFIGCKVQKPFKVPGE